MKTNHITTLIVLSAIAVLFACCQSMTGKRGNNLPTLYTEGEDTTFKMKFTQCEPIDQNYTKCDGSKGVRKTFTSREDSISFTLRKQGQQFSADSLAMLAVGGADKKSGHSFFENIPWHWIGWIIFGLIALAVLLACLGLLRRLWDWATEQFASRPESRYARRTSRYSNDYDRVNDEHFSNQPPVAPVRQTHADSGNHTGHDGCCFRPMGQLSEREIKITEKYFPAKQSK